MASSSRFIEIVAMFTPFKRHDLDRAAGYLRKAGLLPTGARGENAPQITGKEAAALFIGIITSNRPKDAVKVVKDYFDLPLERGSESPFRGRTLGAILSETFESPELAGQITEVSLNRFRPEGHIKLGSIVTGEVQTTLKFGMKKGKGQSLNQLNYVAHGALILNLAMEISKR